MSNNFNNEIKYTQQEVISTQGINNMTNREETKMEIKTPLKINENNMWTCPGGYDPILIEWCKRKNRQIQKLLNSTPPIQKDGYGRYYVAAFKGDKTLKEWCEKKNYQNGYRKIRKKNLITGKFE